MDVKSHQPQELMLPQTRTLVAEMTKQVRFVSVKVEPPPSRDHVVRSRDNVIPIGMGVPHDDATDDMTPKGRPGLQPRSA